MGRKKGTKNKKIIFGNQISNILKFQEKWQKTRLRKTFRKNKKTQKKKKQKVGKKNVKIDLGGPIMMDKNQSNNEKGKKGREDIFKQTNKKSRMFQNQRT